MKPTEYYNYPRRRYRMWWLPLVLILVLVIGGAILRGCGVDVPAPSGAAGTDPKNEQAFTHTVLIDGKLYHVLDREYEGPFALQTVLFIHEPREDNMDGEVLVPVADDISVPISFPRETVMDPDAYDAFCHTWGLKPAFPEHDGNYAVIACAGSGSNRFEVQIGDVQIQDDHMTVLLRDRFNGFSPDSTGFVLTVPVPASVKDLNTEALYNEQEIDNIRKYGNPWGNPAETNAPEKPVIYLYPEVETKVTVKLDYDGLLTCTYPAYRNGWTVTAAPDGTLTDEFGEQYNYLYWEGIDSGAYDFSKGFCVRGSDTAAFLEDALARLGLNRREANEFIVYWLPQMEGNAWNLISFQDAAYTNRARLELSPAPDTLIRVFMAWKAADAPVEMEAQALLAPERNGFSVIEWGGAKIH